MNEIGEHVPLLQVNCDDDAAEKAPLLMNPHLVPPELVKEIVKEQEADIVNDVVGPVVPVMGEAEQPFTV